jgi:hypothetical protein
MPNLQRRTPDASQPPVNSLSDLLLVVDQRGEAVGVIERPVALCGCHREVVEYIGPNAEGVCATCPFRS